MYDILCKIDSYLMYVENMNELDLSEMKISSVYLYTVANLLISKLVIKNNPLVYLADIYTLRYLDCSGCQLTTLPTFLPNLEYLNCSSNRIQSINEYPRLEQLICSDNPNIILPMLFITVLVCRNCKLRTLPSLPCIKELDCRDNFITSIPYDTLTVCKVDEGRINVLHKTNRKSIIIENGRVITRYNINYNHILIDWNTNMADPRIIKHMQKSKILRRIAEILFE